MRFFSLHFTTTHNVQQQNNFIPKLAVIFSKVMNSNLTSKHVSLVLSKKIILYSRSSFNTPLHFGCETITR